MINNGSLADLRPGLNDKRIMKAKDLLIALTGTAAAAGAATYYYMWKNLGLPRGAWPVRGFDLERYLGKWYEIARIDTCFEKNLDNTTAEYSMNDDGSIRVVNSGYDLKRDRWSDSIGKAKPIEDPDVARLMVSFFGPFYSSYNVVELDPEYRYALVVGRNTDYLWFLSRTPEMPEEVKELFVSKARALGFDTDRLVWVDQGTRERPEEPEMDEESDE